ncbi:hypothetical protein ACIBF6_10225 [Streptosporangium amethystogenes]|uniref:hypothetical protein n=1 Tax=Streptosporangium amethystogenes TaxID=2002 RepID=UPI00379B574F
MKTLFPYRTLLGEISLEVKEARLDGRLLPLTMISAVERVVALHQIERDDWERARVVFRMRTPEELTKPDEWADVACVAVLAEKKTNLRIVTPLKRQPDGSWIGVVELHRDWHAGQAEVEGLVAATVDGVAGRVIARTERNWTVDLRAHTPTRKKTVKTLWVDFASDDNPYLNPYRMDPWAVEAAGDEPVVYLNSGFEGLQFVLESNMRADRAVQDTIAGQIAVDCWTALFNTAAYAISTEDDQPQWPGGWHESVLRRMLPDVFPDRSPDDALSEIFERRSVGELQTQVLHAAIKQARTPKSLGIFIRTLRTTAKEEK